MIVAGKVLGSHHLKGEVKVISDLQNIETKLFWNWKISNKNY